MIDVVPFTLEHLREISENSSYIEGVRGFENCMDKAVGYTGLFNDRPVAAAGVFLLWRGVGEGWGVFSKVPPKVGRQLALEMRRRLKPFMQQNELHRIQAAVDMSFTQALRLTNTVGLSFESVMEAYGSDGRDYARFAKVT